MPGMGNRCLDRCGADCFCQDSMICLGESCVQCIEDSDCVDPKLCINHGGVRG